MSSSPWIIVSELTSDGLLWVSDNILKSLSKKGFHIGIVGGGKLDKILQQLGHDFFINHYFT